MSERVRGSGDGYDPVPDELIDALFDGELDRGSADGVVSDLRGDPRAARDAVWTRRALDALRRPVSTPDVTDRVLARVERRRSWLTLRQRAWVIGGRAGALAACLALLAGVFYVQRVAPEAVSPVAEDAPIHEIVRAVNREANEAPRALRETVVALRPAESAAASPEVPAGASARSVERVSERAAERRVALREVAREPALEPGPRVALGGVLVGESSDGRRLRLRIPMASDGGVVLMDGRSAVDDGLRLPEPRDAGSGLFTSALVFPSAASTRDGGGGTLHLMSSRR